MHTQENKAVIGKAAELRIGLDISFCGNPATQTLELGTENNMFLNIGLLCQNI